jgi:predicted secreted Zn-dependent protease
MNRELFTEGLIKIILTLEKDHHGCKEEGISIAKQLLGVEIEVESNPIRAMINEVSQQEIEDYKKVLNSFVTDNKQ